MTRRTVLSFAFAWMLFVSATFLASCEWRRDAKTPTPSPTATQVDKGEEIDRLLDELNNALKNLDTLEDVK